MAKEKNIFKTFKSYLLTEDLKKLWHFYLFLIIFNTWLELFLFALYKPLNMNLSLLITFIIGLVPITPSQSTALNTMQLIRDVHIGCCPF
jgi:hypothetical protein